MLTAAASKRRRSSRLAGDTAVAKDGGCASTPKKAPHRRAAKSSSATSTAASAAAGLRRRELRLMSPGDGNNYHCVVGTDEAGRGPLAGPVVAGACFIPRDVDVEKVGLADINDSKGLNKDDRERLYEVLVRHPKIRWSTGIVSAAEIDRINILQASMLAMHKAVSTLPRCDPDYVLVDGPRAPWGHARGVRPNGTVREADPPMPASVKMCEPIIKGDSKVFCIAAASIIAKVTRDRIMDKLDAKYPGYNFSQHAGYPTRDHVAAIYRLGGVSPEHRMTFKPIRGSALQVLPQFKKKSKNKTKMAKRKLKL